MNISRLGRLAAVTIICCIFAMNGISQTQVPSPVAEVTAPADSIWVLKDRERTVENVLKNAIMVVPGDERFESIRSILDQATTEHTLNSVYDYVMDPSVMKINPAYELTFQRLSPLATFLAYVSTSYSNNAAISSRARILFDNMASRILSGKGIFMPGRASYAVKNALEQYGNAELVLIPSIWSNTNQPGRIVAAFSIAIQAYGNGEALRRLVPICESLQKEKTSGNELISCLQTTLIIYERLKHPDQQWPPAFKAAEFSVLAQELWFADHHERWSFDKLLEAVKKEFPAASTNTVSTP